MAIDNNILLESGTNELEVVEFIVGFNDKRNRWVEQSFGLNVTKVREIIRMPELTSMPNLAFGINGVFNLRGQIVPVVDLRKILYGRNEDNTKCKMIVTEFNQLWIGFIVDNIHRIHRISWTEIDAPDTLNELDNENTTITGIIKFSDRNILMLDVEKIIADIDPNMAIETGATLERIIEGKPIAVTAEDSITIRKMITERLTKAGFDVKSFSDGKSAWEYLESLSKSHKPEENIFRKCSILITDIEMPNMDGYTLTRRVKADNILKKLPVIIFSSMINNDILHKGASVGADAQLSKPQIGELIDTVSELIKSSVSSQPTD